MIPADFPVQPPLASVPGVQPKLLVVKVGDDYQTAVASDEDAQQQYAMCEDLAQKVADKCRTRLDEGAVASEGAALESALRSLR